MKKLLIYLKKYRLQCILAPALKLFEVALELAVPFIVSYMIDDGIAKNNKNTVIICAVILCVFALLGLAFAVTAQYFAAKAAVGFASSLRAALYAHIGRLSYKDLDSLGTSSLITNMTSDITRIQNGVNLALRLLLRSPFVVFGAVIACFFIDVPSASRFSYAVPVLLLFVYFIMLFGMKMYGKVQEKLSKTVRRSKENLDGVRVIRAFGAESAEIEKFESQNKDLLSSQLSSGRLTALLNPVTFVIVNVAVAALIYTGAVRVNSGELSTGSVVAMYNLSAMVLVELIKLADLTINITKALSSAKRLSEVLDIKPSVEYGVSDVEKTGNVAVKLNNVTLSYGGDAALSNIDLQFEAGKTYGIIGGTGSGKTSLISLISRFYDACDGEVLLFSQNIKKYPEKQLRQTVGTVPQRSVLFKGTLRENMTLGLTGIYDETITEALENACALDFVKEKGGLDCEVEQGGKNFSGGQKQRLCIARALLRHPDILILDDSFSALDFATDAKLRENIAKISGNMTVIITAQRVSSVMNSDRIIVLDDGKTVGVGTHGDLLASCEQYRMICASQLGGGEADEK